MPIDWQTPYLAALQEKDPTKIARACEVARVGINDAEIEMAKAGNSAESPARKALAEALRKLFVHEHRNG